MFIFAMYEVELNLGMVLTLTGTQQPTPHTLHHDYNDTLYSTLYIYTMHNVQQSFCRLFLNNAASGKLAAQLFSWQTYAVIFARLVTSVCQAMTSRK